LPSRRFTGGGTTTHDELIRCLHRHGAPRATLKIRTTAPIVLGRASPKAARLRRCAWPRPSRPHPRPARFCLRRESSFRVGMRRVRTHRDPRSQTR
jgi:hypothetical protein